MRTIGGIVIAMAIGACGQPRAGRCDRWVDRTIACDDDSRAMSPAELVEARRMLTDLCDGADQPALGACAATTTCAAFDACLATIDQPR